MCELSEREKAAHEGARDTVKHLITLATASVGVLIAIFEDLIGVTAATPVPGSLWWAFILFGSSVLFGTFALQCLTGNLIKRQDASIYAGNVKFFVILQILGFVAALVLAGLAVA